MKNLAREDAFTLVEILVTIVLISIITIISLYLFTNNFKNIVYSGKKDNAITEASNIMDSIYSRQPVAESNWDNLIDELNNQYSIRLEEIDFNNLDNINGVEYGYCIDDTYSDGIKVSIVVYYLNGEKYVSLTSFIRKE